MARSGLKPFALLLLILPLVAGLAGAAETREDLESRLLDQQQKMHRLSKGIEDQKTLLSKSRHQELDLLTELERLEQQLLTDRRRLAELEKNLNAKENRLDFQQVELDKLLLEQEEIAARVAGRLEAFYRMGEVGVLNALFSSSSLPELLDLEEYQRL